MAVSQKKNIVAKAAPAAVKSAPAEIVVAPAAVAAVMQASAEEADKTLQAGKAAFAAPAAEIQESFRSALEKGVVQSRAAFAKAKTAADETANAFEVSLAAAKDGALAINTKAFDALRVNADANFDFFKAVFAVKSLPDLITLQTEFARKQVETIASQTKDFGALAQKAMADAVGPIKEQMARSFKVAV
jgi:phasin